MPQPDPDFDMFKYYDLNDGDAETLRSNPPPRSTDTALTWASVVGNAECKAVFQALVKYPRPQRHLLIHGPNRSGKTSLVHLTLKAKFCRARTPSLDPCLACHSCLFWDNGGRARLGGYTNQEGHNFRYYAIDGTNPATFDEDLVCFYRDRACPLVLYVDEVSHPEFIRFMPRLVKPMGESPITVVASGVRIAPKHDPRNGVRLPGLSKDFHCRFTKVMRTTAPQPGTFLAWLRQRAEELNLHPTDEVLVRLIERAGEVAGQALRVLWEADLRQVPLTTELVEQYQFDVR